MSNDNETVLDIIKKEYSNTLKLNIKKRNIKIPSNIHFKIDGNSIKMKLTAATVCSNMQKDDSAFEGWALVLKRWAKYEKVLIHWEKPDNCNNGHYQRFLFRLKNFSKDFKSWFYIDDDCKILLNDLKINESKSYILNMPGKRGTKVSPNPEALLEERFVNTDLRESLISISNAVEIYRQLPVGVFEDKISTKNSIFTGGKSAIDIWGINKENELLIFELKAGKNEKVGIISELYFYVCVLQNVRKQSFKHENCKNENTHLSKIPDTKKVKAYFLAPTLHPLVDFEILKLLNEIAPKEVIYQYIQFDTKYNLTLNPSN